MSYCFALSSFAVIHRFYIHLQWWPIPAKGNALCPLSPSYPELVCWAFYLLPICGAPIRFIWLEPNWLFMEGSEEVYLHKRFRHLQLSMIYRHGSTSPQRLLNHLWRCGNIIATFHQDRHDLTWYWASSPRLLVHQREKTWELEMFDRELFLCKLESSTEQIGFHINETEFMSFNQAKGDLIIFKRWHFKSSGWFLLYLVWFI